MAIRAYIFVFLCLFSARGVAQGWQANLETDQGILQLIGAHYTRHPGMLLSGEKAFRPDFTQLMREAQLVGEELNLPKDRFFVPNSAPALSMRYQSSEGRLEFDAAKIEQLKAGLKQTLRELREFAPQWSPKDLATTLNNSEFRKDPKMAQKLMQILPWFLDLEGRLLVTAADPDRAIIEKIDSSDGQALTIRYYDIFKNHLLQTILDHSGFWRNAAEIYGKQFFEKTLQEAITLFRSQSGTIVNSTVSIELVPPLLSLIKIFDCSMKTIPFYPLLPDTHVFWIRRNPGVNSQPSGYALVHMATIQGQKIPYVITVNGSTLNEVDTRAALVLIAQYFGVEKLAVPDFERNPGVVNDNKKKEGMAGAQPVKAYFSKSWKDLTARESIRLKSTHYAPYYNQDSLIHGKLTDISPAEKLQFMQTGRRFTSPSTYVENDYLKLKLKDRAILLTGLNTQKTSLYQALLKVPESAKEAAHKLVNAMDSPTNSMKSADVESIVKEFEIPHLQVLKHLHPSAQVATLGGYGSKPQWAEALAKKLADDLDIRIQEEIPKESRYGNLISLLKSRQGLDGFAGVSSVSVWYAKILAEKFISKEDGDRTLNPDYVRVVEGQFLTEMRSRLLPMLNLSPREADHVTSENLAMYCTQSKDPKVRDMGYRLLIATRRVPSNPDFVVKHLANVTEESASALQQILTTINNSERTRYNYQKNPMGITYASHLYTSPFLRPNYPGQLIVFNLLTEFYLKEGNGSAGFSWNTALEKHCMEFFRQSLEEDKFVPQIMPVLKYYLDNKSYEVWQILKPHLQARKKAAIKYLAALDQKNSWPVWFWEMAPGLMLDGTIDLPAQVSMAKGLIAHSQWTVEVWEDLGRRLKDVDNSVKRWYLIALGEQPIWTPKVWDAVLNIMENETDMSVVSAIQEAIRFRLLPEAHKVALKKLQLRVYSLVKSPPPGQSSKYTDQLFRLYQDLESTRVYNVGVRLTTFPHPVDRDGKWKSCEDELTRENFEVNKNKVPFWVRTYRFFTDG